jgi:hypothetical protein
MFNEIIIAITLVCTLPLTNLFSQSVKTGGNQLLSAQEIFDVRIYASYGIIGLIIFDFAVNIIFIVWDNYHLLKRYLK